MPRAAPRALGKNAYSRPIKNMAFGRMVANDAAHYLDLTLEERNAARTSTSIKARERHEKLAIAYEIRCLLSPRSDQPKGRLKL